MWQDCGRAIGVWLGECSGMCLLGIADAVSTYQLHWYVIGCSSYWPKPSPQQSLIWLPT